MAELGYLQQPTIAGDTVVFVCDDDVWSTSAAGGLARRLTAGLGEPSTPALSPDGQWLAYVSRDEQHPEVYRMPAAGGPARRLTWLGSELAVRGWTPQGRILFASSYGQPFAGHQRAFTLDPSGGLPELLPYGTANHVSFGPGGARVIGRHTQDPARWKRYRGGTAGQLWVDASGSGDFRRLRELTGNPTSPIWLGARIYFLSDFEGVGNLYSCRPDGSELRRHTDHDEFYARRASSDGRRIVYQCGAELWLFDPASERSERIPVRVPAHRTQAARRFVPAAEHLSGFHVHPAGHSAAVEVRGKLFSFALWEGAVRQHGCADGVRYRHGQWLADGSALVAVSDASGEERLELFAPGAASRTLSWDIGRVLALRAAPRGRRLALANHRHEVFVIDLEREHAQLVERSPAYAIEELTWSPDGAWLAYPFALERDAVGIRLYDVAGERAHWASPPQFRDWSPSFDADGKYLCFLSLRTFDPVYDTLQFELSFPRGARPYLIALQADAAPPFELAPRGMCEPEDSKPAAGPVAGGEGGEGAKPAAPAPLRIDLEGIEQRVAAFPVPEARYGQLVAAAKGKLLWTVLPIAGAHGRGGHKDGPGRLEVFDFAELRVQTLLEKADRFALADDRRTLLVQEGRQLRALDAAGKPDAGEASGAEHFSRKSGWIDLGRIRVSIDPPSEWRQMLREVWRLQRDQFWVPDLSGVDWEGVYKLYAPLLERVATRAELSDLIWELQGELGTSHAYEGGGDHRRPPELAVGQLGADLRPTADGEGFEIAHLVEGDPWESAAHSPLRAIGVQAQVGERIAAVNGQPVTRERPPQALLVNQALAKVELTLEKDGRRRDVLVHALRDEAPARYREWVEANRRWVHERSAGRVGYFHLPDMMAAGFAEFHRYFRSESNRGALLVDVRHNRGGHVSSLLLEKVARQRIGWDVSRWNQPEPYPSEAPAGPVVALANERAGSDGDIFSHAFKLMGVGPLVGTRTWGGVIGISPRHRLVDGTSTTQPEYSFWFKDVGWGVENYGTDPDIEIDNAPQDVAAGRDRQLEKALEVALELLERAGPREPDLGSRPNLARRPLPPRR